MRDLTRDFLKQNPLVVNALAHQIDWEYVT